MKKIILLLFLLLNIYTIYAQNRHQDNSVKILFLEEYPYANVLECLNNPDTIIFCHYIPRRYEEKDAPTALDVFIYKKNNEWWSTTLTAFSSGRRKYWRQSKPMWIQTDLTLEMEGVIAELDGVNYIGDISTVHTWVYVKYGRIITKDIIGNIRDFADIMPEFSYVFIVGLLESYNKNIIKTYKK